MLASEDKFLTQIAKEFLGKSNIVVVRTRTARGSGGENIAIYEKIGSETLLDKQNSSSSSIVSARISTVKKILERSKREV